MKDNETHKNDLQEIKLSALLLWEMIDSTDLTDGQAIRKECAELVNGMSTMV